jgi:peptidoglycan/xylan/chitin deacetylase (PgdA/CDA1 family)
MTAALALTYHAVDSRGGALSIEPAAFAAQLDCIVASGAQVVRASELADSLRARELRRPAVTITFDDGLASVARTAAPLLAARGLAATVFCVSGHLGGTNEWPSASSAAPRLELATADELAALAQAGWEIGCHGMTHAPLNSASPQFLEREVVESKRVLEEIAGVPVRAYAYPYGAAPSPIARDLVERTFYSAWTTALGYLTPGADLWALPRVDVHYVRQARLLRAALAGSLRPYLRARRLGAGVRRAFRQDYVVVGDES